MKATVITAAILGAITFALIGMFFFIQHGGNNCDVTPGICDCFCCEFLGQRGYEGCGLFGFLAGGLLGGLGTAFLARHLINTYHHD